MTGTSRAFVTISADLVRYTFEQHNVGTGILQTLCRFQHFPGLVRLPALHLEPTDLVH